MPVTLHSGFRWRRRSRWRRAWRRSLGGLFVVATTLVCFWGLVGACETSVVTP